MADVKWIKITVDMFDDEKIKLIQSMPEGDAILVCWIRLLCMAGKCNADGYVFLSDSIPYTEEMMSTIFGKPVNIIRMALDVFERFGMVQIDELGICVVNWEKHQNIEGMERIKELNRNRQAKFRSKALHGNTNVTECNDESNCNTNSKTNDNITVTLHNGDITEQNKNKNKIRLEREEDIININVNNNYAQEFEILQAIQFKGAKYPFDPKIDEKFIFDLYVDFPNTNIIHTMRNYSLWLEGNGRKSTAKWNPRLAIRNWVEKDASKQTSGGASGLTNSNNTITDAEAAVYAELDQYIQR